MARILIIEDNKEILYTNRTMLELKGYDVISAETISAGMAMCEQYNNIALIILDIMLPDGNGLEFCKEFKKRSDVKVLFLSALNTKKDVIAGLRAGGDDYLGKPYHMEEFLLRVESLLKRKNHVSADESFGNIEFHGYSLSASCNGDDLLLRSKEYLILKLLCDNPQKYFSAVEIFETVWGIPDAESSEIQPVYNCISAIKDKISSTNVEIGYIRNKGYTATKKGI